MQRSDTELATPQHEQSMEHGLIVRQNMIGDTIDCVEQQATAWGNLPQLHHVLPAHCNYMTMLVMTNEEFPFCWSYENMRTCILLPSIE